MILAKEGMSDENLPESIPDLMLCYLNDINRQATADEPDDAKVHAAAAVIAWECLRETFQPMPANRKEVLIALGGEENGLPLIKYFEERLKIIQTVGVARNRIRFSLEPLSEYLAALHLINEYGANDDLWRAFLVEADTKDNGAETITGFLLAVRDCCLSKGP